jgi:hypothetical protein
MAVAVQAVFDPIAAAVEPIVHPVAPAIQSSIDPIATVIQPIGKLVSAVVTGPLRPMIQPLVHPIPASVQAAIDTIAASVQAPVHAMAVAVQAVFDPIAAVVESIFHPVAPAVEPLLDAIAPAIQPAFDIPSSGIFIGDGRSGQENSHKNRAHHCRTFFQHDQPPFSMESAVAPSTPCGFIRLAAFLNRVNASSAHRLTKKMTGMLFRPPVSEKTSANPASSPQNPKSYFITCNCIYKK